MRMPGAKDRYQKAELSMSLPFPPPCSVSQRGCLSCHSLAWHPEVLAPAWLSSPSVLAAGDIPTLSPLGLGILVLAGKSIQASGPVLCHHLSGGQSVPRMGQMPGQWAPACISPGPEQHGVQRYRGPVAPHAAHPCSSQYGSTHQLAPLAAPIQAHGYWDPEIGSGSARAEMGAVPESGQDRATGGVGPPSTLL